MTQRFDAVVFDLLAEKARVGMVATRSNRLGAGAVGMPVWWRNRGGVACAAHRSPIAEHDSLRPLVDVL